LRREKRIFGETVASLGGGFAIKRNFFRRRVYAFLLVQTHADSIVSLNKHLIFEEEKKHE
jgi:hypothetical protein